MTSTGNDIVALKATNQSRSIHPRFYSKFLSISEQDLFYQQVVKEISFEKYIWLMWSVKESVYKFLKRTVPNLLFSPVKITIRGIHSPCWGGINEFNKSQWERKNIGAAKDHYKCDIIFGSSVFYSRSIIYDEVITTVVSQDETFEDNFWGIKTIESSVYDHQSRAVRTFVLNRLNSILANNYADLSISKNARGCPILFSGTRELNIPVSLAHHDHFIAYSFLLSDSISYRQSH